MFYPDALDESGNLNSLMLVFFILQTMFFNYFNVSTFNYYNVSDSCTGELIVSVRFKHNFTQINFNINWAVINFILRAAEVCKKQKNH